MSKTRQLTNTEPEARLTPASTTSALAWPRITLVTAVYNGEKYLEATIRSIISQGYPNLEYIVVDGASTDGTVEIIRKYEKHLAWWVSQPDKGMYDALNTGFARSSGEIFGWLNASDMLHVNSLFVVGSVFAAFPEVEWITGRPTHFNTDGRPVGVMGLPRWSRYRFLAGANKYIQQESTYWRKGLWERAGGYLDAKFRAEGDFDLWVRFFRYARLYSVNALIGGYRFHSDSLTSSDVERYNQTCDEIIARELDSVRWGRLLKPLEWLTRALESVPLARRVWLSAIRRMPVPDLPPMIVDEYNGWVLKR